MCAIQEVNTYKANGLESIYADAPNVLIDDFAAAINQFQNDGLDGLSDSLSSIYVVTDGGSETFTMTLPFRINAFADYSLGKNFYTNFSMSIAPAFSKKCRKEQRHQRVFSTPDMRIIGLVFTYRYPLTPMETLT